MIKKCITGAATPMGIVGLVRASRDRFVDAPRRRARSSEEGSLLVEVLVGMLVLIIVFTATTIALSSMADQRVRIEQRDRALALISSYEEESRVFRCGYLVDRIGDSLASPSGGTVDFQNIVKSCDFKAKAEHTVAANAGDQDFTVKEVINENLSEQKFDVSIRYWWETPGKNTHTLACNTIDDIPDLPLILVRAFRVQWKEGAGPPREETLIKREPVPGDDVVFVSGNRVNILVNKPGTIPSGGWYATMSPLNVGGTIDVNNYIQRHVDGMLGQPVECVWFPYITADGIARSVSNTNISSPSPNALIDSSVDPQSFPWKL